MEVSMMEQSLSLLLSLFFGVLCGALYDVLRILRVLHGVKYGTGVSAHLRERRLPLLPHTFTAKKIGKNREALQKTLIFFGDLFYAVTVGLLFCVFVYWQNDGSFRFYLLVGAAVGASLYLATVGRLVIASAETIAACLRIVFLYLLFFVYTPVRFVLRHIMRILRALFRFFCRLLLPLYSAHRKQRLLKQAEKGSFAP